MQLLMCVLVRYPTPLLFVCVAYSLGLIRFVLDWSFGVVHGLLLLGDELVGDCAASHGYAVYAVAYVVEGSHWVVTRQYVSVSCHPMMSPPLVTVSDRSALMMGVAS